MKKIERAQIVKFHTPFEDEDPNQLYVVLEVFEVGLQTRAKIEALNTGFTFAPINIVLAKDLEIDEIQTKMLNQYLAGHILDESNL